MVKQPFLVCQATAITRERAVRADDAMTGHDDGDGIRSVGSADSTTRSGATYSRSEPPVTDRGAGRNCSQFAPNLTLKWRVPGRNPHRCERLKIAIEIGLERPCEIGRASCRFKRVASIM